LNLQRPFHAAVAHARPERGAALTHALTWAMAAAVTLLVLASLSQGAVTSTMAGYAWRLASVMLAGALVASVAFRLRSAVTFLTIFAPWMAAMLLLLVVRLGDPRDLEEIFRHVIMLAVGACVFAGVQSATGRALITRTMWALLTAIMLISVPPALELLSNGWSWEAARYYKWINSTKGLAFNTNFFILAMLVIGLWPERKAALPLWWAAVVTLALGSVLFATRAPPVSAAIAALFGAAYAARRRAQGPNAPQPGVLPLALLLIPFAGLIYLITHPTGFTNQLFTLRTYIWQIALVVWREAPIFGHGWDAMTAGQNDALNAPTFDLDWERITVHTLRWGGYHNIWLDTLTSKGLVGFLGLLSSYYLMLRLALARAGAAGGAPFLIVVLLLLYRGYVEVGGPYSYQNSPLDFMAMVVLAWCAAVAVGNFGPANAVDAQVKALAPGGPDQARAGVGTGRRL
jgi:O-antigen ligase